MPIWLLALIQRIIPSAILNAFARWRGRPAP